MASYSQKEQFHVERCAPFLAWAEALRPTLHTRRINPRGLVAVEKDATGRAVSRDTAPIGALENAALSRGDALLLDFGDHWVGHVTIRWGSRGSHPDAPLTVRLKFGETPGEMLEDSANYDGWISKSWIQEEVVHVDVLPATLRLPRRYAFRYLEIQVIDTSPKYSATVEEIWLDAVSAVDVAAVPPLETEDPLLRAIDRVSLRTLANCMQDVFEDGPKRDRRLWLGDLRLQALANYATFRENDLVKRCLYLFAGMPFNGGNVSACLFTEPEPEPDDTHLLDYALLFVPTLWEYWEATGDRDTLAHLFPTAMAQLDMALAALDGRGVLPDGGDAFWCFLDWAEGLNKQAGATAVLLYSLAYGVRMAGALGETDRAAALAAAAEGLRRAVRDVFWDEDSQLFVSGEARQISWATQVWMVLAGAVPPERGGPLLRTAGRQREIIPMVTPYMVHYYVEALRLCGEREAALSEIRRYWGGMIGEGADTFWELYNPQNSAESPYGSRIVNSYCHAWSCTPAYFLRKLDLEA